MLTRASVCLNLSLACVVVIRKAGLKVSFLDGERSRPKTAVVWDCDLCPERLFRGCVSTNRKRFKTDKVDS